MIKKGKFIVLYGINNLGKTTQAKLLVEKLIENDYKAEYLKYPIYNLEPSGHILNNYLRQGNTYKLTPREAQIIYTQNRTQYEKELIKKLESGINIIAEDYTGTGLAWGIGAGVDEYFLKYLNSHLLREDVSFLFEGERFKEATEAGHRHETDNKLTEIVRQAHLKLGKEMNWLPIDAGKSIKEIHETIWLYLEKILRNDSKNISPNFLINCENESGKIENLENNILEQKILKVEKISPDAKIPSKAHENDAGYDLYSVDEKILFPEEITGISTGIKIKIPENYAGLIWDKSGLAKRGLKTMGGVIDSGYRGEIIILVKNAGNEVINIEKGQKIAQILIQKVKNFKIVEEKVEDDSTRGKNGFGSSGLF